MPRLAIVPIAQALAAALTAYAAKTPEAGGPALPLQARYAFAPEYDPATDLQVLTVTVVPKATQSELGARGVLDQHFQIDLGIQKQLAGTPQEVETLLGMVVVLDDLVQSLELPGLPVAWIGSENAPIYAVEHLRRGVFTSVLTVTYRVIRGMG